MLTRTQLINGFARSLICKETRQFCETVHSEEQISDSSKDLLQSLGNSLMVEGSAGIKGCSVFPFCSRGNACSLSCSASYFVPVVMWLFCNAS